MCSPISIFKTLLRALLFLRTQINLPILLCALLFVAKSQAADNTNMTSVALPISLTRNRIMLPTKVNGTALSFLLDTGYGINMIHPDLIEPLKLQRAGKITIVGIAGEEEAGTYSGAVFDLGGMIYSPRRLASLPSEAENHRRRRDGILGAGFFRRFVVEMDFAEKKLRLHEPGSFSYVGKGEIIPLHFEKDTPIIEAAILSPTGAVARARFEVDTGCDDYLCLDPEFVEANRLAGAQESSGIKRGVGGNARIRHGAVPELRLGHFVLANPTANFFTDASPAGKGLAGHIGLAALQHYKVIFDYSRRQMILEEYH